MRVVLVVLAALVLAACGEEEQAPPTEALPLSESLRVAGHSYECAASDCARYLIVAPAFEAQEPKTTRRGLSAELEHALRAKGWRATGDGFRSPGGSATVRFVAAADRPDGWSNRLATQVDGMVDAGQPALAVTLTR